jgi:hypothetical protein
MGDSTQQNQQFKDDSYTTSTISNTLNNDVSRHQLVTDNNWDGESTTASQMGEEEKAELREKLARAEQERESQAEEIRRLTVQLFQANAEKQVAEECSKQNAARAAEEITTKKREIDTLRGSEGI